MKGFLRDRQLRTKLVTVSINQSEEHIENIQKDHAQLYGGRENNNNWVRETIFFDGDLYFQRIIVIFVSKVLADRYGGSKWADWLRQLIRKKRKWSSDRNLRVRMGNESFISENKGKIWSSETFPLSLSLSLSGYKDKLMDWCVFGWNIVKRYTFAQLRLKK